MSYLDEMRAGRINPETIFHKIRTTINTGKYNFFALFEGAEDETFYSEHINSLKNDATFYPIVCDGKVNVLSVRSLVISKFGSARNIYFFVDSDHDNLIGDAGHHESTFTTDHYSFESYGLDEAFMKNILKKNFDLNKSDPICDFIDEAVDSSLRIFTSKSLSLSIYLLGLRGKGASLKLDDVRVTDLIIFNRGTPLRSRVKCRCILERISCEHRLTSREFLSYYNRFKSHDKKDIIRGKFFSLLLNKLSVELLAVLKGRTTLSGRPCAQVFQLSKLIIAQEIAKKIPPSTSLRNFILTMP